MIIDAKQQLLEAGHWAVPRRTFMLKGFKKEVACA